MQEVCKTHNQKITIMPVINYFNYLAKEDTPEWQMGNDFQVLGIERQGKIVEVIIMKTTP